MSQWQNPSWPQASQARTSQRPPADKPDHYSYALPTQRYIRHPYLPSEFDSANGDPNQFPSRPSPSVSSSISHPQDQQPAPSAGAPFQPPHQVRPGVVSDPQYVHMSGQQYPGPPSDLNNFHVPQEQWEPLPLGGHAGSSDGPAGAKKSWQKDGADPDSTGSNPRSASSSSARPRLESVGSGQKVTKRSRMGCLTCRLRKKRCCETRPKCSECQRLRLNCQWPKPGTEHKNKPKEVKSQENMMDHHVYGKIKVLRGIVEYRSN